MTSYTIELMQDYKSLKKGLKASLPSFSVITGLNGSGKSNLLEAFQYDLFQTGSVDIVSTDIIIKNLNTLNSIGSQPVNVQQLNQTMEMQVNQTYNIIEQLKNGQITEKQILTDIMMFSQTIKDIISINPKPIINISKNDIKDHFINQNHLKAYDIFFSNFEQVVFLYERKKLELEFDEFKNGNKNFVFNEETIKGTFGLSPLKLIANALKTMNLPYQLLETNISLVDLTTNNYMLKFKRDGLENENLSINDFSSGEKILMSIAISIFNLKRGNTPPKLILLDEPDAQFHPFFVEKLMKLIKDDFIGKYGIRVIITSHSPTTVALADEASIFVMKNGQLKNETKDAALKALTVGVPHLSYSYENRKTVIVESDNDVEIYSNIYQYLINKGHLKSEISLIFISSGIKNRKDIGTGDKSRVVEFVEKFRLSGNKKVYGIIDWDKKNNCDYDKGLFVLGENKRYSIENYLYDPLLLGAYLIRLDSKNKTPLNLDSKLTVRSVTNNDEDKLKLLLAVKNAFPIFKDDCWYTKKGRDFFDQDIKNNKNFGDKFNNYVNFTKHLFEIFNEYTEFINQDFIDLFIAIQNDGITIEKAHA